MSTSARLTRLGVVLAAGVAFGLGAVAPAQAAPSGGANGDCGAYCPNGVGKASGNGNGNSNTPHGAGTVGKADSKFPPGQADDGSDDNNGYECDGNNGVGKTNPAHSGCGTSTYPPDDEDGNGNS